jgi:GT2 family glycosyltransferase
MKVSVVVPVYNQSQLTERCLNSLLAHSSFVNEVIIINNASQDNTMALLNDFQERFTRAKINFQVITNLENNGFGRASNQGVREFLKGDAQYITILSNDTWLMPKWDTVLIDTIKAHRLDCAGPYFYEKPFQDSLPEIASAFIKRNKGRLRHHFTPMLIFYTRETAEKLSQDSGTNGGVFDERFFVTYEDADLVKRMELRGIKYMQTGSCFIWHKSKGTRSEAVMPSNYEQDGYRLFFEKWGFDPRPHQDSFLIRLRRKYWKFLEKRGRF